MREFAAASGRVFEEEDLEKLIVVFGGEENEEKKSGVEILIDFLTGTLDEDELGKFLKKFAEQQAVAA
jgi:hypothetical protein